METSIEAAVVTVDTVQAIEPTTEQSEPKVRRIRTGPTYRFPKGMKAPSGSGLTIKTDGTVSYRSPTGIPYSEPGSKPFRLPAMNPRTDAAGKTFERLKELTDKRAAQIKGMNVARFIGRPVADGFRIVSTDGHAALLERVHAAGEYVDAFDKATQEYCKVFDNDFAAARTVCSIAEKDFHLALKRARVMNWEKFPKVRLIGSPNHLRLASNDPDCGSFDEFLPVQSSEFWHASFDIRLLEPVCGTWPLLVRYVDADAAVSFEPSDGSWRYVVMPVKDSYNAEQLEAELSEGMEIPNSSNQIEPEAELCVF